MFEPLVAKDARNVLEECTRVLTTSGSHDVPGGLLRTALVRAFKNGGWHRSGLGSDREMALTRDIGRANGLTNSSARDVQRHFESASVTELIAALGKAIAYLKQ